MIIVVTEVVGGTPVVGFEMAEYTVLEGQSVQVCVQVLSGGSNEEFFLQILNIFVGSASGKNIIMNRELCQQPHVLLIQRMI